MIEKIRFFLRLYEEIFRSKYRGIAAKEFADAREVILISCFPEILGLPGPVGFFALELYPEVLQRYHQWHLRSGMEKAPEGGFKCC
jgi:hypothetical protein